MPVVIEQWRAGIAWRTQYQSRCCLNTNIAELIVCSVISFVYLYLLTWISIVMVPCSLLIAILLDPFPLHILLPSTNLLMRFKSKDSFYIYTTTTSYVLATAWFVFLWLHQLPKSVTESTWKFQTYCKYVLSRLHYSLLALLIGKLLGYTIVGANSPLDILLLLSGKIETNPGPQLDRCFKFLH